MFWPVYMINWFSFLQHHNTLLKMQTGECPMSSNTARYS